MIGWAPVTCSQSWVCISPNALHTTAHSSRARSATNSSSCSTHALCFATSDARSVPTATENMPMTISVGSAASSAASAFRCAATSARISFSEIGGLSSGRAANSLHHATSSRRRSSSCGRRPSMYASSGTRLAVSAVRSDSVRRRTSGSSEGTERRVPIAKSSTRACIWGMWGVRSGVT